MQRFFSLCLLIQLIGAFCSMKMVCVMDECTILGLTCPIFKTLFGKIYFQDTHLHNTKYPLIVLSMVSFVYTFTKAS